MKRKPNSNCKKSIQFLQDRLQEQKSGSENEEAMVFEEEEAMVLEEEEEEEELYEQESQSLKRAKLLKELHRRKQQSEQHSSIISNNALDNGFLNHDYLETSLDFEQKGHLGDTNLQQSDGCEYLSQKENAYQSKQQYRESETKIEFLWDQEWGPSSSCTLDNFLEEKGSSLDSHYLPLSNEYDTPPEDFMNLIKISPSQNHPKASQPNLNFDLYPHQLESLHSMMNKEENGVFKMGLLCDDVGLGKSSCVIGLITSRPCPLSKITSNVNEKVVINNLMLNISNKTSFKLKATLLFVPNSLLGQWKNEFVKFAPHLQVEIYCGSPGFNTFYNEIAKGSFRGFQKLYQADVIIISSYIRDVSFQKINTRSFHRVIIDESHHKIPKIRFTEVKKDFIWFLTATPFACSSLYISLRRVTSYFEEGYVSENLLKFRVRAENSTGIFSFRELFSSIQNGSSDKCKLFLILLSTLMIVHLKDDCENLIPPSKNIIETIKMDEDEEEFYQFYKNTPYRVDLNSDDLIKLRKKILEFQLKKNGKYTQISVFNPFKNNSKFMWVLERLKKASEKRGGVVNSVICVRREIELMCLRSLLEENSFKVYYFDSHMGNHERAEAITKFQNSIEDFQSFRMFLRSTIQANGETDIQNGSTSHYLKYIDGACCQRIGSFLFQPAVFIIMRFSGSFGINLQNSSELIYFEDMNQSDITQLNGRIHRIGQRVSPVNIRVQYELETQIKNYGDLSLSRHDFRRGFLSLVGDSSWRNGLTNHDKENIFKLVFSSLPGEITASPYWKYFMTRFLQFYEWDPSVSCQYFLDFYNNNILTLRLHTVDREEDFLHLILGRSDDCFLNFCKRCFLIKNSKLEPIEETYTMIPSIFGSRKLKLGWSVEHAVQVFESEIKTDKILINEIIDTCLELYFKNEERKWIMKY